jgi:hypothetical protein
MASQSRIERRQRQMPCSRRHDHRYRLRVHPPHRDRRRCRCVRDTLAVLSGTIAKPRSSAWAAVAAGPSTGCGVALPESRRIPAIKIPPFLCRSLAGSYVLGKSCPKISVPASSSPSLACTELLTIRSTTEARSSSRSFEAVVSRLVLVATRLASRWYARMKHLVKFEQLSGRKIAGGVDHDRPGFARLRGYRPGY